MIVCHETIIIGNDVPFGSNVLIYDYDFRALGWLKAGKYRRSPILMGNNVWIGVNVAILRSTIIGDNCVVSEGCVLNSHKKGNSLIGQKGYTTVLSIAEKGEENE